MPLAKLYQKRRQERRNYFLKYAQYIFNDHLVLALFFLLGALAFQYQAWLKTVTEPSLWADGIFLLTGLVVILLGQAKTYIQAADTMFLLPMEASFNAWFKRSFFQSLLSPLLWLAIYLLVAYPYLWASRAWTWLELIPLAASLTISTFTIMVTNFEAYHFKVVKMAKWRWGLIIVSGLAITLALASWPWWGLLLMIVSCLTLVLSQRSPFDQAKSTWFWEKLVSDEAKRQQNNDKLMALFVDVKTVSQQIKRRPYLDRLLLSAKKAKTPFYYLYQRSFWRSPEFFPIWARLTILGLVFLAFLPDAWLSLGIILVVQYFSHFQIWPLFQHFDRHPMVLTAPVGGADRGRGFLRFIAQPLLIQGMFFSIFAFIFQPWRFALVLVLALVLIGGLILPLIFKKKIEKANSKRFF